MGWKMKNFNILGVHGEIQVLGGGEGHEKPIYRGDCLKRGPWTVCRFKGGEAWQEGGGWCLWGVGGWYPNGHYAGHITFIEQVWEKKNS